MSAFEADACWIITAFTVRMILFVGAGPGRPLMAQQKSGSFRQREAERMRRFIAARQLSGSPGGCPLDPNDPIRATEEAHPLADLLSRAGTAEAHHHEQACYVFLDVNSQPELVCVSAAFVCSQIYLQDNFLGRSTSRSKIIYRR